MDVNTPHAFFVDDDCYAEVHKVDRIEQAIAASIEVIFILLGDPNIKILQHPVSFDKLEETQVDWTNKLLGVRINTRLLTVPTPVEYIEKVVNCMNNK